MPPPQGPNPTESKGGADGAGERAADPGFLSAPGSLAPSFDFPDFSRSLALTEWLLGRVGRENFTVTSARKEFRSVTAADICGVVDGLIAGKDEGRFLGIGQSASTFAAQIAGQDVALKVAGGAFLSASPMDSIVMFLGAFRFANKVPNMNYYNTCNARPAGSYKLPRLNMVLAGETFGTLMTVEERIHGPTLQDALFTGRIAPDDAKARVREVLDHFAAVKMVMFDVVHLQNFRFAGPETTSELMVVDANSLCMRSSYGGNPDNLPTKFDELIEKVNEVGIRRRAAT